MVVVCTTGTGIERHEQALDICFARKRLSPGGVGIGVGALRLSSGSEYTMAVVVVVLFIAIISLLSKAKGEGVKSKGNMLRRRDDNNAIRRSRDVQVAAAKGRCFCGNGFEYQKHGVDLAE